MLLSPGTISIWISPPRSTIKAIEGKRDELVQSARAKISVDEAREVIIDRLRQTLMDIYQAYLRADQQERYSLHQGQQLVK